MNEKLTTKMAEPRCPFARCQQPVFSYEVYVFTSRTAEGFEIEIQASGLCEPHSRQFVHRRALSVLEEGK